MAKKTKKRRRSTPVDRSISHPYSNAIPLAGQNSLITLDTIQVLILKEQGRL